MPVFNEKKIIFSLLAASLAVLTSGLACWWNTSRLSTTFHQVRKTQEIIQRIEQSVGAILIPPPDQLGSIPRSGEFVTGAPSEPNLTLDGIYRELRLLTTDDHAQLGRLENLRLLAAEAVAQATANSIRNPHPFVVKTTNTTFQKARDDFLQLASEMTRYERRRLNDLLATADKDSGWTLASLLSAVSMVTLVSVWSAISLQPIFQRHRQNETALLKLRADFEKNVRRRAEQIAATPIAPPGKDAQYDRPLAASKNEDHHLPALDDLIEGCQIVAPDWRILYVNASAATHGRRHKQALLGHSLLECYPSIERTVLFTLLLRCFERRSIERCEQVLDFADGSSNQFSFCIRPHPAGVCLLSLELTPRHPTSKTSGHDYPAAAASIPHHNVSTDHLGEARSMIQSSNAIAVASALPRTGGQFNRSPVQSDVSHRELRLTTINHDALLADTIAAGFYYHSGRPILWEISPLPAVQADAVLLRQLWRHLLDHAVNTAPPNIPARIIIGSSSDATRPNEQVFSLRADGCTYTVDDRGPPAEASALRPVQSALRSVHQIISRHGGRIWFESRPQECGRIYFSLPTAARVSKKTISAHPSRDTSMAAASASPKQGIPEAETQLSLFTTSSPPAADRPWPTS